MHEGFCGQMRCWKHGVGSRFQDFGFCGPTLRTILESSSGVLLNEGRKKDKNVPLI